MGAPALADRLIWALARECRDGDVVIVGVATPLASAAAMLAREFLVPGLTVLAAASVQPAAHDVALPMLEPDFVARRSAGTLGQAEVLDLIQRGGVSLQFVSPAQVDRHGRLNASELVRGDGTRMRFPGPLALPDVAGLVGRLVAYRAEHSRRFLVSEVDVVTGIGSRDTHVRREWHLPGGGLVAAVTGAAVLRWDEGASTVRVDSIMPGVTAAEVVAGCGFPLAMPDLVPVAADPPADALEFLDRVLDPHHVRGIEVRGSRAAALASLTSITR